MTNNEAIALAVNDERFIERFWSYVDKSGECWEWKSHRNYSGYANVGFARRTLRSNRVAWSLSHGPITAGMHVLHSCDNRGCVNPAHLRLGTHQENMNDAKERKRFSPPDNSGQRHGLSKLTEAQALYIRARFVPGTCHRPGNGAALAAELGVSREAVRSIAAGRRWKHLV